MNILSISVYFSGVLVLLEILTSRIIILRVPVLLIEALSSVSVLQEIPISRIFILYVPEFEEF